MGIESNSEGSSSVQFGQSYRLAVWVRLLFGLDPVRSSLELYLQFTINCGNYQCFNSNTK